MFTESASFYDAIYAFKDYDAEMREAFLAEACVRSTTTRG